MIERDRVSIGGHAPELLELGRWMGPDPTGYVGAESDPASFSPAEVAEVAYDAGTVNFWSPGLEAELAELERDAEAKLERALAWLAFHRDHPWEAPLTGQRQVWVGLEGAELRESDVEPVHGYFGFGYYRPYGGVSTTSEVPDYLPSRLDPHPNWRQHIWGLHVRDDVRVYEVRTPEDWTALVGEHPQLVESQPFRTSGSDYVIPGPFYIPRWESAALGWDGVRFTMGGKLRTINLLLPVLDGYTMMIDEFCNEQTLWFRWVFEAVDDLGSVPGTAPRDRQPLLYQGARDTWPRQLEAARRDGWEVADDVQEWELHGDLRDDDRWVFLRRHR